MSAPERAVAQRRGRRLGRASGWLAGAAVCALLPVLADLLGPVPVLALGGGAAVTSRSLADRRRRREVEAARRCLPATLDLVAVCIAAGLTPGAAFARVAASGTPRAWWADVARLLSDGVTLADAIDSAGGPDDGWVRRDLGLVAAAARAGGSVGDALDRTVADLRSRVRRDREERARRLPVTLLAPLTGCVLPAVMFMVVVPMVGRTLIGGV